MREPTPSAVAFAWHANALLGVYGDECQIHDEEPQVGYFKRRLVRGGVYVPAKIWLDQEIDPDTGELLADERLQCEVAGEWRDPHEEWPRLCGHPISEADFNYLTALRQHCAWHEPDQPFANPKRPIDWLAVSPPQFQKGTSA